MKVAIIGAGISGVSAARMLKEKGHNVILYEKNEKPGGLIRCDWVKGNLFHKVGGHVFNAKDKEVADWFWNHFDRDNEFIKAKRNAKILLQGKIIGYPLENNIYQLDSDIVEKIVNELLLLHNMGYKDPFSFIHFEAFLKNNFGDTLYNLYFKPYNQKMWQTDLTSVPMAWLKGKLPMPDYSKMFVNNITRAEEKEMVHSTFYYPKKGGSQFIIDRLAEGLIIKTGYEVDSLEFKENKWWINQAGPYDKIIYTADVRMLEKLVKFGVDSSNKSIDSGEKNPIQLLEQLTTSVNNLKANGTSNVLCYTDTTDISWLYLPDPDLKAHRIIYTGNFSVNNNAMDGRKTCVVEFSGKVPLEIMKDEIKKLPGNLEFIQSNYEPNSYVIQLPDTRNKVKEVKQELKPYNFYLLGRFAEWEYYNMDTAIEAVMELSKNITIK